MEKHNIMSSYTGILFGNQKEETTDTSHNMAEPQKHYGKWKMSDTKDHILHDSVYMKYPEKANLHRMKIDDYLGCGGSEGWLQMGRQEPFQVMEMFYIWIRLWLHSFINVLKSGDLQGAYFMECKLYLNKAAKIVLRIFFKKREYCVLVDTSTVSS